VLQDSYSGAAIDPTLATQLEELNGVDVAAGMSVGPALLDGDEVELTAVDPARFAEVLELGVVDGTIDLAPGQLAMSAAEAADRGLTLGDEVGTTFVDGSARRFTLAATYGEVDIAGDVLVRVDEVPRRAGFEGDVAVLVDLAPGIGLTEGAAIVDRLGDELGAPQAQTRDQYLDTVIDEVQTLLGVVYGLLGLAVVIALMGIANTLALAIHERTRELGLLRAVGQTRAQLRAAVRWESTLIAVFGTIGGVGLGVFLGWTLVRAVAVQEGFGTFTAPAIPLVVITAIGAAAGTLAAVRPARRAARLDVVTALATS
jgi:putative ABC transport system permease protein